MNQDPTTSGAIATDHEVTVSDNEYFAALPKLLGKDTTSAVRQMIESLKNEDAQDAELFRRLRNNYLSACNDGMERILNMIVRFEDINNPKIMVHVFAPFFREELVFRTALLMAPRTNNPAEIVDAVEKLRHLFATRLPNPAPEVN